VAEQVGTPECRVRPQCATSRRGVAGPARSSACEVARRRKTAWAGTVVQGAAPCHDRSRARGTGPGDEARGSHRGARCAPCIGRHSPRGVGKHARRTHPFAVPRPGRDRCVSCWFEESAVVRRVHGVLRRGVRAQANLAPGPQVARTLTRFAARCPDSAACGPHLAVHPVSYLTVSRAGARRWPACPHPHVSGNSDRHGPPLPPGSCHLDHRRDRPDSGSVSCWPLLPRMPRTSR